MSHLVKVAKLAPSQTPYWFADTYYLKHLSPRVNAYWLSRKNGQTVVTVGEYSVSLDYGRELTTPHQDAPYFDTRWGGEWCHRWDGQLFQVHPNVPLTDLSQQEKVRSHLSDILDDPLRWFDERPQFSGPWYKKMSP